MSNILLGCRFAVFFFPVGTLGNLLDIRFQKVSGLSTRMETEAVVEGGQNLYRYTLPKGVESGKLVLRRGVTVGSPLALDVNLTLSTFQFRPCRVIVTLFNELMLPVAAWLFLQTYPIAWSIEELDAGDGSVLIDTLELAYTRMQQMRF